jgi:hypothetical protein
MWVLSLQGAATVGHPCHEHRDAPREILGLTSGQIKFLNERLTVGRSKIEAGAAAPCPLMSGPEGTGWATNFPQRKHSHFVFASERYGLAGENGQPHSHAFDSREAARQLQGGMGVGQV